MERVSYEAEAGAHARTAAADAAQRPLESDWRGRLLRKLGWVLALKLAALTLIWYLWFAPGRLAPIDGLATRTHFGLADGRLPADQRSAVEQENLSD